MRIEIPAEDPPSGNVMLALMCRYLMYDFNFGLRTWRRRDISFVARTDNVDPGWRVMSFLRIAGDRRPTGDWDSVRW